MFFDESGIIARDRFFTVGCLKLSEPSTLIRAVEKWRDRHHRYEEIHFVDLTNRTLSLYQEVIDIISGSDTSLTARLQTPSNGLEVRGWRTKNFACQLLVGSIKPREIVTVIADAYSTPDDVVMEQDVRSDVNNRLRRLAVASVVRVDPKAATPL